MKCRVVYERVERVEVVIDMPDGLYNEAIDAVYKVELLDKPPTISDKSMWRVGSVMETRDDPNWQYTAEQGLIKKAIK